MIDGSRFSHNVVRAVYYFFLVHCLTNKNILLMFKYITEQKSKTVFSFTSCGPVTYLDKKNLI